MTASRSRVAFVRRRRAQHGARNILVPFNDEELAIVEAEARAHGLSLEDYLVIRALDAGEVKGHA